MIQRILSTFLLLAVAVSAASTPPRVNRASLVAMEKSFDEKVNHLWQDNPFVLLGNTRGIYLDGYGAVFTAEINLVLGTATLMHEMTKDEIAKAREKKKDRIPEVKKALSEVLASTAASPSMNAVPDDEQIVFVVWIFTNAWEDAAGLPTQISAKGQKRKLVEAQRAHAPLEPVVTIETN